MAYIWEYLNPLTFYFCIGCKEDQETKAYSPYIEAFQPYSKRPERIMVNPAIRFDELLYPDDAFDKSEEDQRFNLVMHWLAELDTVRFLSYQDLCEDFLSQDIMAGYYGTQVKDDYEMLDAKQRRIVLHHLSEYRDWNCKNRFFLAFLELFGAYGIAEIHYQKSNDIFYCCCSAEHDVSHYETLFELIRLLFADARWNLMPVWGTAFGVLDQAAERYSILAQDNYPVQGWHFSRADSITLPYMDHIIMI